MRNEIDQTLSALADPTCRKVLESLVSGPKAAGELAREMTMSARAMSRHLRILRVSGLVRTHELPQDVRVRMYQLEPERLGGLRDWLLQLASFWEGQLSSFKNHVEHNHLGRDT